MAVREFNNAHTGDVLSGTVPAALDVTGAVTWAFVVKRTDATNWSCLLNVRNTTPVDRLSMEITASSFSSPNALRCEFTDAIGLAPSDYSTWTDLVADGWVIVVLSKGAGSVIPVQSIFKAGAWTHMTTGSACGSPATTLGGTLRIGSYQGTTDWLTGRLAAAATWVGTALTTTQIAALSTGSISSWAAVGGGPTEHWEFNQATWATSVPGLKSVLNLAAAGTGTIVTGDDPASGVYTLTASGNATVTAVPALSLGSAPAAVVSSGAVNATVTAVPALSLGASPVSTVSAGSTVAAPVALSLGSAPAANGILSSVVNAPAAVAAGSAPAPVIPGAGGATVAAVPALAAGSSPVPALRADQVLAALAAVSAGAAPAPAMSLGATVAAVAAVSLGQALRPTISPAPIGAGGDVVSLTTTFAEDSA